MSHYTTYFPTNPIFMSIFKQKNTLIKTEHCNNKSGIEKKNRLF